MNVNTSVRSTQQHQVASVAEATGHTSDALTAQLHSSPAANDDTTPAVPERMVNPLWMITVGLGAFFGLGLLLLASG